MKTLFSKLSTKVAAITAGVLLGGLVLASTFYVGYNPVTGMSGAQGIPVSVGTPPTTSGTCGTLGATTGGQAVFTQATAAVTTCTLTVTIPTASAAPNGLYCVFVDETNVHAIYQASHTSTTCTSNAATITAGDTILVEINGF